MRKVLLRSCIAGVSVYSCYKGGAYTTMSATSMTTPDGDADPIAHI